MFPFLFFLGFFFSICRIYRDSIPLLVTVFSQAGYFSLACPSLSFGNLKKSRLLFRAVRGSIGVKNRPPGNGVGYNLVTTLPALSCLERVPPQRRVWRGHLQLKNGPGSCGRLAPLIRQGCALPPSPWGKASSGGGLFIGACPGLSGVPSTPGPASPVHPLQAGEGLSKLPA